MAPSRNKMKWVVKKSQTNNDLFFDNVKFIERACWPFLNRMSNSKIIGDVARYILLPFTDSTNVDAISTTSGRARIIDIVVACIVTRVLRTSIFTLLAFCIVMFF